MLRDNNTVTWFTEGATPLDLIKKGAIILAISVLFGLVYPGVVAYYTNTFFESGFEERLKTNLPHQWQKLHDFNSKQDRLSQDLEKVDSYLTEQANNLSEATKIEPAIALHQFLENQKHETAQQPPLRLSAFYLGSTMHLWPAFYTFIGWLIFLFPPKLSKEFVSHLNTKKILLLSFWIVVLYRWPTWWRNTPLGQEGRRFYGVNNFDIDRAGFFVQETLGVGVAVLVAIVLTQWSAYYEQTRTRLAAQSTQEPIEEALRPELSEELSMMFLHWQIASSLLALAFFWYTVFFWHTVMVGGDSRFLVHAIIVHSMWLICWIVVSLPLLITSYHWHNIRSRAAIALSKASSAGNPDPPRVMEAMDQLQPISYWNVAASAIAVIVSFLAPILKNFFR